MRTLTAGVRDYATKPWTVNLNELPQKHGGTRPGVRTFADRANMRFHRPSNQELANAGYVYVECNKRFPITDDFVRWCNDQFGYKHWVNRNNVNGHYIFFTRAEDATAFILRWPQDEF